MEGSLFYQAEPTSGKCWAHFRSQGNKNATDDQHKRSPHIRKQERGYAEIRRRWHKGDTVTLDLPLELRLEKAAGDGKLVSVLRGPMVLAADLGPADKPFEDYAPAMVGDNLLADLSAVTPAEAVYRSSRVVRPAALTFKPFYSQYDRRTALYFRCYSENEWSAAQVAYVAEQKRLKDMAARSLDVMHPGEMQAERDHNFRSENSNPVIYRGRNGRDARKGGFMEFDMKSSRNGRPLGPLVLSVTCWGLGNRSRLQYCHRRHSGGACGALCTETRRVG